jgi:hypothetical protein
MQTLSGFIVNRMLGVDRNSSLISSAACLTGCMAFSASAVDSLDALSWLRLLSSASRIAASSLSLIFLAMVFRFPQAIPSLRRQGSCRIVDVPEQAFVEL